MVSSDTNLVGDVPRHAAAAAAEARSTTFIGCHFCRRPLSAAEVVERWCIACASETRPAEIKRESRS